MRPQRSRPMQSNLFGVAEPARTQRAHSAFPKPAGFAAPPGSGTAGETCSSCTHCRFRQISPPMKRGQDNVRPRRVYKCGLMTQAWSNCRSTDVLANSPACRRWEPGEPQPTTVQKIRYRD